MTLMDKSRLLEALCNQLRTELQGLSQAAASAYEAATHEEARSEDKHDTRSIEASYLAGAQAQRAAELEALLAAFSRAEPRSFAPNEPIAPGALVELKSEEGKKSWSLLSTQGGGLQFRYEGKVIQVVTLSSPVGEELLGRKAGDTIEVELRGSTRELEILSVT
jgi:transcription elongation GreA/GreB family factor